MLRSADGVVRRGCGCETQAQAWILLLAQCEVPLRASSLPLPALLQTSSHHHITPVHPLQPNTTPTRAIPTATIAHRIPADVAQP